MKIVRPDRTIAEIGEAGEVAIWGVPGRTIFPGYFEDPEATARVLQDNWFYTGDNAFMDEDGYFWWVDRLKDMIKRGGENVSATEVENTVTADERVQAAAAIAIPDPVRDEAILLFVQPSEGATISEAEVLDLCIAGLARFKVPSRVVVRDRLPTTPIGKIDKHSLRTEVAALLPDLPES